MAIPSKAFKSLLKYVYHDQISIPLQDAFHLYSVKNKISFTNKQLQEWCKNIINDNISKENALEV